MVVDTLIYIITIISSFNSNIDTLKVEKRIIYPNSYIRKENKFKKDFEEADKAFNKKVFDIENFKKELEKASKEAAKSAFEKTKDKLYKM